MLESRPQGLYFEEFSIGQEFVSPARTITEADIVQFAGLSGDYNQLHTDAVYAAQRTAYGKRIAHGLLILSVASGLAERTGFTQGTTLAFMNLEWRFKSPVFIGDTIALRARVSRVRAMPSAGGGIVVFQIAIVNQDGLAVQRGEWSLLMRSEAGADR